MQFRAGNMVYELVSYENKKSHLAGAADVFLVWIVSILVTTPSGSCAVSVGEPIPSAAYPVMRLYAFSAKSMFHSQFRIVKGKKSGTQSPGERVTARLIQDILRLGRPLTTRPPDDWVAGGADGPRDRNASYLGSVHRSQCANVCVSYATLRATTCSPFADYPFIYWSLGDAARLWKIGVLILGLATESWITKFCLQK